MLPAAAFDKPGVLAVGNPGNKPYFCCISGHAKICFLCFVFVFLFKGWLREIQGTTALTPTVAPS